MPFLKKGRSWFVVVAYLKNYKKQAAQAVCLQLLSSCFATSPGRSDKSPE